MKHENYRNEGVQRETKGKNGGRRQKSTIGKRERELVEKDAEIWGKRKIEKRKEGREKGQKRSILKC
jgi:hypothetical protein